MSFHSLKSSLPSVIVLFVIITLTFGNAIASCKKIKCQTEEECHMKPEHFRLYSEVKHALDQDLNIKGKDLVVLMRSAELLSRRFSNKRLSTRNNQPAINGTSLVLDLLSNPKLVNALEVFRSDEGRQLVNLYKTTINGNQQNLACSKWRVGEIEFAARKLEQKEKLAEVFANIHKNFVQRSARKCLKTSCGAIEDNMNRLDSILKRSNRRKGFLVHSLPFEATTETVNSISTSSGNSSSTPSSSGEPSSSPMEEEALIAHLVNEPVNEFQTEELELCRFLKRTNASNCQISGNEISEITFVRTAKQSANETSVVATMANISEYLSDYQKNSKLPDQAAGETVLAQCSAIEPVLDYHLFGLRWYQRQGLISAEKLRKRVFWCPSLTYWFEIDRLCDELKLSLNTMNGSINVSESFAY